MEPFSAPGIVSNSLRGRHHHYSPLKGEDICCKRQDLQSVSAAHVLGPLTWLEEGVGGETKCGWSGLKAALGRGWSSPASAPPPTFSADTGGGGTASSAGSATMR